MTILNERTDCDELKKQVYNDFSHLSARNDLTVHVGLQSMVLLDLSRSDVEAR